MFFGGPVGLEFGELLPEGRFEVFELDVGLGGDGALEDRVELEGAVGAVDVLCDLLLVDEGLIEAARLAAAENLDEEVGFGVAWGEGGRGEESDAELWEFDGVGDRGALLFRDRRCG